MVMFHGINIDELEFSDSGSGEPVSEEDIYACAESQKAHLPPDYVEFLSVQNGGCPKKCYFKVNSAKVWISRFLFLDKDGFSGNEESDPFSLAFYNSVMGEFVPKNYLIIGIVVRDDLLVIDCKSGAIGIVHWADVAESETRPNKDVVNTLSESLSGFLLMLSDK